MSQALGISRGTIKSWLDRSGRTACKKTHKPCKKRMYYAYEKAGSADEWLEALRQEIVCVLSDEERILKVNHEVYLVCGATSVKCGVDTYSTIISSRLKMNPFDGMIYAFFNKKRDKIYYLFWDAKGFNVVSCRCERGTYPWPSPVLGTVIPISSHDFELVLRGDRATGKNNERIVWDSLDL